MVFFALWIPFYLFIAAVTLTILWWRKRLNYWADRGIVHEKPSILYGNMKDVGKTMGLREPFQKLYMKYKNVAPFAGFYFPMRITVVLLDLELIKQVLVKDFSNFSNRGAYYNTKDDPLSAHLFNLDGESWRYMRTKLTPTFTSAKMKYMFPTIVEVAKECVKVLQNENEQLKIDKKDSEGVEIRELLARFTTDVIGSCAFGLNCNSLQDPQTKFRTMGKKIFSTRRHGRLVSGFAQAYHDLARKLGIVMTHQDVSEFFLKVVDDTVAYREKSGIERNDFMNILLELKNQQEGLTMEEIAAQAFVFFIAGFETSSSTMGFALFELASHQEMQAKVRVEIEKVLARFDGKITYESMREMHYLEQIICETLRKYSILPFLSRQTLNDFSVPNSKHVFEKGLVVVIPVDAIHHDPEIYPDPARFDPTRFDPEAVSKRHPMSWLPFGEGPRNCIGLRFGKMQATVGLALLLKHFKFTLTPKMKGPLEMNKGSFTLNSKDGIYLCVERIANAH